ncbi:hypothetical protein Tco_0222560 [Tanacetum coccineum]
MEHDLEKKDITHNNNNQFNKHLQSFSKNWKVGGARHQLYLCSKKKLLDWIFVLEIWFSQLVSEPRGSRQGIYKDVLPIVKHGFMKTTSSFVTLKSVVWILNSGNWWLLLPRGTVLLVIINIGALLTLKSVTKRYGRKEHFILPIQVSTARVDVSTAKVIKIMKNKLFGFQGFVAMKLYAFWTLFDHCNFNLETDLRRIDSRFLRFRQVVAEHSIYLGSCNYPPKSCFNGRNMDLASGSGPRCQDTILGDVNAQTRFEIASKQSNDPPLSRGYTLGSGEDSSEVTGVRQLTSLVDRRRGLLIQPDMSLSEEPESILDRQERVMRNKVIPFVKILWKNHPEREATWETEESMRASYPHFFV